MTTPAPGQRLHGPKPTTYTITVELSPERAKLLMLVAEHTDVPPRELLSLAVAAGVDTLFAQLDKTARLAGIA